MKSLLTAAMIAAGRRLLMHLDSHGIVFDSAFWLHDDELGEWRLMLSSSAVRSDGPRIFYRSVNRALADLGLSEILTIEMISVVDERTPPIERLVSALGQTASVDGVRLDGATFDGERMPGCLLYRLTARQLLAVDARQPT